MHSGHGFSALIRNDIDNSLIVENIRQAWISSMSMPPVAAARLPLLRTLPPLIILIDAPGADDIKQLWNHLHIQEK